MKLPRDLSSEVLAKLWKKLGYTWIAKPEVYSINHSREWRTPYYHS
jgi:hypothetical protein